jgi:hypothetical protein
VTGCHKLGLLTVHFVVSVFPVTHRWNFQKINKTGEIIDYRGEESVNEVD